MTIEGTEQIIKEIESKFEKIKHEVLALLHSIKTEPIAEQIHVKPGSEPLVPAPVVAKHLGISEPQVRSLEKQGKLPSYRPGGRLLFKISECEDAVRTKSPLKQVV
jgi:excisionase family DNA binding protein